MRRVIAIAIAGIFGLLFFTQPSSAQTASPLTAGVKAQFSMVKDVVIRTAQKVPEDLYTFRPTPEVRSFAELFGHVADGFRSMCTAAAGGKAPESGVEKVVTRKAELVKALTDAAAVCDSAIAGMTDAKGTEQVPFYFGPTPKLSVLYFAVAHGYEHYGNLVTYMRLKGIIPPSSETPAPTR